jgi:hypothetical protein
MNQVVRKKLGTGKEYRTERKGMAAPDGRQKLFRKALKGEKNQIEIEQKQTSIFVKIATKQAKLRSQFQSSQSS